MNVPMVVMKLGVQASSQNLSKRHDFPTPAEMISRGSAHPSVIGGTGDVANGPESPISNSLIKKS